MFEYWAIPDNRDTPLLRKDNCVLGGVVAFNEVLGGVEAILMTSWGGTEHILMTSWGVPASILIVSLGGYLPNYLS